MLERLLGMLRKRRAARALQELRAHCHPEDSPELALRIAQQRSKGTRIGRKNPQLIEIGDNCVIGGESILLAHGPGFNGRDRLVIEDEVYIGYRVTVLPGVTIGVGSIIGAGAVVTRDIPAGKVAAGNPARILRDVTDEERADMQYRMANDLYFGRDEPWP